MRMKEDPMMNGQLKPGYNLQAATSKKFFLAYQLFSNPTDTRTLIPFLQTHSNLVRQTQVFVADAGYGSESNYRYIEDAYPQLTTIIPYNTYIKEQSKRWWTDDQKIMNWTYVETDDYYIDPQGVQSQKIDKRIYFYKENPERLFLKNNHSGLFRDLCHSLTDI